MRELRSKQSNRNVESNSSFLDNWFQVTYVIVGDDPTELHGQREGRRERKKAKGKERKEKKKNEN